MIPIGLQVWEATGDEPESLVLRYANAQVDRQARHAVSEQLGATVAEVFPGAVNWAEPVFAACIAQEPQTMETQHVAETSVTWWRAKITPLGGRSVLVVYWNVTEQKRAERRLVASERLNREIIAGLLEGVLVVGTDARIMIANAAAGQLFGVPESELVGRPLTEIPVDLFDEEGRWIAPDRMPLARALNGEAVRSAVMRLVRHRDGMPLWIEAQANPLLDEAGRPFGAVASYDDVTLRVEQDRRTRHEADTDALTGLANRRALERTLATALARAAARGRTADVLMVDLDGFKRINDTLGHAAGDAALREVARRLRRCVRERDMVARLGGDEFVVLLADAGGSPGIATEACTRVEAALATPFEFEHNELRLRAAIGIATFPTDGVDTPSLLAHADRAMYRAKAARTGRQVDSPA